MRLYSFASMAALAALACRAPDDDDGAQPAAAAPPAPTKVKRVHVVWCAPGHETYAPGMMVRATPDMAEGLRANGKARPASDAEVKAAADAKLTIPIVD